MQCGNQRMLPRKVFYILDVYQNHLKCCYDGGETALFLTAKVLKVALHCSEQNMRVNLARDGDKSDTLTVATLTS